MNLESTPSFYPVEPLLPWLQAGVPLLTPNQRLARQIKLAWGVHQRGLGIRSWETPAVYSLEQWWLRCFERLDPWQESQWSLATEAQQLHVWQQCIAENPDSGGLLRPRAAAMLARDAHRSLQLWSIEWRKEPIVGRFRENADTVLFEQWAHAFEARLDQARLKTLPQMLAQTASLPESDELVLVEFNELAPLYQHTLESQSRKLSHFRQQGQPQQRQLQPCETPAQQLAIAAGWAYGRWQANPQARIAILLPDMQGQRQALQRQLCHAFGLSLSDAAQLPVNFSGGTPLSTTAPVDDALQLLALLEGDIDVSSLVQLLQSRYYSADPADLTLPVVRRLLRRGRAVIGASQWRYLSRELSIGGALLALHGQRELKLEQRIPRWIELILECLSVLGWPGPGPLGSEEYQQVEQFYQVLESLAELDALAGSMGLVTVLGLLRQACSGHLFQRQTPATPIQALGLLEAAGLAFDHTWLVGMNSTQWPAPANPNPFIPVALQRQWGMPHADARREREFAQRLLLQFESCSGEIYASYVAQEGGVALRASALLHRFQPRLLSPAQAAPDAWRQTPVRELQRLTVDVQAPPVGSSEIQQIRGGSGLIADQSHCEFRAFAHHRLGVKALNDLTVGLTAADRGTLLHDALYQLWGELIDSAALAAASDTERQRLSEQASAGAVQRFAEKHQDVIGRCYLELEQRRLTQLLQQWLQVEAQRLPFSVHAREAEVELTLSALNLKLRIDRVDRLADNSLLIIDYKSGDNKPRDWFSGRPRQPQLPLYTQALEDEVAGIAFAIPLLDGMTYRGLAAAAQGAGIGEDVAAAARDEADPPQDWQQAVAAWQQSLQQLAENFLQGKATVEPISINDSCRYCGLQSLCRIGQGLEDE